MARLQMLGRIGLAGLFLLAGLPNSLEAKPVRVGAVEVELKAERESVSPGGSVWLGLSFSIDPEWHLYWVNPGAFGFPPSVVWELPDGITVEDLQFPIPKEFESAGQLGFGYEKKVVFLARAQIADSLEPGMSLTIKAKADWLGCDPKTCVPGNAELDVILQVAAEDGPALPALEEAENRIPERVDWKLAAQVDEAAGKLNLEMVPSQSGFAVEGLKFYPEQAGLVQLTDRGVFRWEGDTLHVEAALHEEFTGDVPEVVSGLLLGTGLTESGAVLVSTAGLEAGSSSSGTGGASVAEGAETGGEASGEGWGSWLQKPLLVMALAALMFLIGLNLMGVFEVGTSLTGAGGKVGQLEGPMGSFLSGGLATVVATPCTAPFMGSAIFYALAQPAIVTLAIFTFLGLGMATPYLLLSRFPSLIEKLPRPGPWMETLKQALAFPMFAVVIWLIWVLSYQINPNGLLAVMIGLLLLAGAGWWVGRFGTPVAGKSVRNLARVGAALLVCSALILAVRGSKQALPAGELDVEATIAELQSEGKGVFVDFTAAWCLTCQANKAALHATRVTEAFAEQGVEFLEVDWTQRDAAVHRVLQKYGREGVPLYLLFSPEQEDPPRELPNLLTEDIILTALTDSGTVSGEPSRRFGFWGALFGAFVGGLILNLMPCVFPVISLKILGFVSQAGSNPKLIWHHGLAFAGGVLSFFWLLAFVLLGARAGLGG